MSTSGTKKKIEKRKVGRPATGKGEYVGLRIHRSLLDALDQWNTSQPEPMTRPEAIRYALKDWLIAQGVIEVSSDRDDLQ